MPIQNVVISLGSQAGALLVGTIFAAAGWLVTYTVDNIVSLPTIEYEVVTPSKASEPLVVVVKNLSRKHKFSNLSFLMKLPEGNNNKFLKGSIEPIPPAYWSDKKIEPENLDITFEKIDLHPGTEVKLVASYSSKSIPTFHIMPSNDSTRLLEKGTFTWLLKNELFILIGLFIAWVVTVGVALCLHVSIGPSGGTQNDDEKKHA